MKDISASLPEIIKAYKDFNLLIPSATDVQLNPFYKYHVEEVAVDLSETSGDIFKVGVVDTGRTDNNGKKIYVDTFSLSKPLLNKMAMAAGIQFNPLQTYGERIDRVTYRAHAQGAMRKADGTCRIESDQKEICLEDEEEKYRIEFSDKASRGITDEKQAKAAIGENFDYIIHLEEDLFISSISEFSLNKAGSLVMTEILKRTENEYTYEFPEPAANKEEQVPVLASQPEQSEPLSSNSFKSRFK